MRDLLLITPEVKGEWCLDLDIINGVPKFVPDERNTQDQRAAISAYTIRGTIPGKPEVGINWAGLYEGKEETLTTIDNEIKQAIQANAATPDGPNSTYMPVYNTEGDGIEVTVLQG